MKRYRVYLRCIGCAVAEHGLRCLLGAIPFAEKLLDIAKAAHERYRQEVEVAEQTAQIQAAAQASMQEVRQEVAEVLQEVKAQASPEVRQQLQDPAVEHALDSYLQQVPGAIQRSVRRPSDPTGTTIPPGLRLSKAEDLLPFLPSRMPRFKEGDSPANLDFELLELLGVGGFGEVWKAWNPYQPHDPPVALKLCLDQASAASLRHESALLSRIKSQGTHRGIVKLLSTHLRADPPALVYEYIDGGNLAGLLQDHPSGLTPQRAGQIMLRLAQIVGFTHRLNPPIVHRDIKPANILLQKRDGKLELKVADFGIGGIAASQAIAEARGSLTRALVEATVARGSHSVLYASPQQTAGERADPRDDVYALGVVWYQMLTGELTKGRPGGSRWLDRLVERGIPPGMGKLLESCFEEDPEDRPGDAGDLAEKLPGFFLAKTSDAPPRAEQEVEVAVRPRDAGDLAEKLASSFSPKTSHAPPEAEQEVEVAVRGKWCARPENEPGGEWQVVRRTPRRVSVRHGEVYCLKVVQSVTDEELRGLAALRGVTRFQHLDLCDCKQVTDAGLAHLKGLTSLQHLNLCGCKVTDAGLAHLKDLTALRHLVLGSGAQVTDAGLAHLKGLAALQHLKLWSCTQLTDAGVAHLKGLTSLQHLNLSGCKQMTDAGLSHLKGLTALQHLDLCVCQQVTDAGLAHLKGLTALQHLHLRGCKQVTDAGLAHLTDLTSLQHLNLCDCKQVTDAGLAHLKGLTALQHLNLCGCKVTDAALAHLKGLTALRHLVLSGCQQVTDAGLAHLKGLTALQHLDLCVCQQVTDAGLAHLQGLTSLQHLNLGGCKQVTDAGLAHLKGLTSLQHLYLSVCQQVTDAGLAHLQGLAALQHLYLYGCRQVTDAGLTAMQLAIPRLFIGKS
jgi:serine/threonine protein kinase/Leucine-rich repeat (LRR) protein